MKPIPTITEVLRNARPLTVPFEVLERARQRGTAFHRWLELIERFKVKQLTAGATPPTPTPNFRRK